MVRGCRLCKREKLPGETDVHFHAFPKDEEEKEAWLKALGWSSVAKTAVICSDHFTDHDYVESESCGRKLKKGVDIVPSRNLHIKSREQPSENLKENTAIQSSPPRTNDLLTSSSRQCRFTDRGVLHDRSNFNGNVPNSLHDTGGPSQPSLCEYSDDANKNVNNIERLHLSATNVEIELASSDGGCQSFPNVARATAPRRSPDNANSIYVQPCKKMKIVNSNPHLDNSMHTVINETEFLPKKRALDETASDVEKCDEQTSKKLRLTVGCKTMSYSGGDFRNQEKWSFFTEYVEHVRKEKKNLQRNYKSLQKSVKNYQELLQSIQKQSILNKKCQQFMNGLSEGVQLLISSILQGNRYKVYPDELRNFALNLHFYSPQAYTFVKENFGKLLPSFSTLRSYLRKYNFEPGISKEALESVTRLIEEGMKNKKQILFNLTCDEMSIRQLTQYDPSSDRFVGHVDYGTSKIIIEDQSKSALASSVMVFMLVAMNSHFKIPIAHYFVKSSTGDHKKILLQEVLDATMERGIVITNLTFDGVSSNISMVEELGAKLKHSTSEVFFEYTKGNTKNKIRVTLDACHALKLVRNTVEKYDITDGNGGVISWKYIKSLQKLQETEQLHPATKLRRRHIYFKNEIMKVNLAAQTLSSSVAKALDFCRVDLNLYDFQESEATSTFAQNVNDSFDILNSRNIYNKNPGKHAITRENLKDKKKRVNELVHYFEQLTIDGTPILQTKQHTGFLGLVTGLKNAIAIAEDLFATFKNFSFILTYKFSQDHLETFFSCIRRFGGFNSNPSALQFRGAYRKLLAHASISVPLSANCTPRDETVLGKVNCTSDSCSVDSIIEDSNASEAINIDLAELQIIFDLLDEVNLSDYIDDVVAYISGSVIRVIKRKISCQTCLKQLEIEKDEKGEYKCLPLSKLQQRKAYGKLISSSRDVVEICRTAEKVFRLQISFAENNLLERMILKTMHVLPADVLSQSDHVFDQEFLADHRSQVIKLIIKQYLTIRLHYVSQTDAEKQERLRLRLSKLLLFKGL